MFEFVQTDMCMCGGLALERCFNNHLLKEESQLCTQEQDSETSTSLKASHGQIYASFTKWKLSAFSGYCSVNELLSKMRDILCLTFGMDNVYIIPESGFFSIRKNLMCEQNVT